MTQRTADVLVIGGGPAGATAALRAARRGLRTVLFERDRHPRFHVGESFLPKNLEMLRRLGLEERLRRIPHTVKLGATFVMGDGDEPSHYHFREGLHPHDPETFNIERAPFDAMMAEAARDAGAETIEKATVRTVEHLDDGDVRLEVRRDDGTVERWRGGIVLDASGQSTMLGRHLKTRRTLPDLEKVAYFTHARGVERAAGERAGYPVVVICREGWFWLIPIDEERTSVGLVIDAGVARATGVAPREMLGWGIERCPQMRARMREAVRPDENGVTADFSYRCWPYAGPGYFMLGDAATFIDPIFSTGVCLGMMSGVMAADGAHEILRRGRPAVEVRRRYNRTLEQSSSFFFRLVRHYYDHSFREMFLHGVGPLAVHRAIITALSGHVFPRPSRSVRWRLRMFDLFIRLNRWLPLVPRRSEFSLLAADRALASGGEDDVRERRAG